MDKETLLKTYEEDRAAGFDAAVEAIRSEDRNVRVAALRIVAAEGRPGGSVAILAGLGDPKRRVRQVALVSSRPYLDDPAVASRIREIVEDDRENGRLRMKAMAALGGGYPSPNRAGAIPRAALAALESLAATERYRAAVLNRLVAADLTPEVASLLREFVRGGTKDEAVAATRALCGYRLVNWGSATPAELEAAGAEQAVGVFYWIRRDSPVGPPF